MGRAFVFGAGRSVLRFWVDGGESSIVQGLGSASSGSRLLEANLVIERAKCCSEGNRVAVWS